MLLGKKRNTLTMSLQKKKKKKKRLKQGLRAQTRMRCKGKYLLERGPGRARSGKGK